MRIPIVVVACTSVVVLALPAGAAPPPQQQIAQLKRQVAALETKVKQLQQQKADLGKSSARAWRRELALRRYAASEGSCAVTRPNDTLPPEATFRGETHGNGSLWVLPPVANVVVAEPGADGAITTKFPWWRQVTGTLRIEGRRLDGTGPPLSANVPDGYGSTGFQASLISFPTEGCWRVIGSAGPSSLTFVTLVLKSSD